VIYLFESLRGLLTTPFRNLRAVLAAALMFPALCAPVSAAVYSYQGQIQIQPANGVCGEVAGSTYDINIYGRDDGPQRFEGFLVGDGIVEAYFIGNNLGRLEMMYPGETSPKHVMRLRAAGNGEYVGDVEVKSMVSMLYECPFSKAQIRFRQTGMGLPAGIPKPSDNFQVDVRAVQAYILGLSGRVKEAIPILQQVLDTKERLYPPGSPQILGYYYFLGQLYNDKGAYADAIGLFKKGLNACNTSYGPGSACSVVLEYQLGTALSNKGDNAASEAALRDALANCSKLFGPDAPASGLPLNALSVALIYTGRYSEAETTLEKAMALNHQLTGSDNGNVGISLNNLAVLYRQTGRYKKAETAQRKALAVDQKALGPDHPVTVLNTLVLSQILRVEKQYPEAEKLARSGLATAQRIFGTERPDNPSLDLALVGLADILVDTNRYAEAQPLYQQAMDHVVRYLGPEHVGVGAIALSQAKLLRATGRDTQALAALKRAYAISHISDNQSLAWRAPAQLMEFYATGSFANRTLAIYYGKEAVNDLQRLRGNLAGSAEVQTAFVGAEEVVSIYRTLATLLLNDRRFSEAQQVRAMVKEQELYDFSAHTITADTPKTATSTLNSSETRLDQLANQEVTVGRELGELQDKFAREGDKFSAADRARLKALHKSMDAAQSAFDARVAEVAKSSTDPEAQKRRQHEMVDFSTDFEASLKELGHNAVLAQYFIEDDKVAILLTTPDAVVARESPIKRSDLNALIMGYRKTLSSPTQDPLPQAQALYRLLIAPITGDLQQAGAKTLMLSLDDTLRYLPFAALHDGQKYLVENLSIVMVTDAVRDKLNKQPNTNWSVWGLGITKGGKDYDALPYAGVELNSIAGKQGILAGKVLLDGAFTETSLRDGLDQSFPVIHIASHFQFTPGSMDDSFLLLGDGKVMTLSQIKNKLNFKNVELLTLSACETALGDNSTEHHGAEVEGLGAIAQQAGAKAVLATLWPVADASTAILMRELYQAHKVDHLDKADGLRQAQLALIHGTDVPTEASFKSQRGLQRMKSSSDTPMTFRADPKAPYAHPFYWAPFILMGNWL
jgi:CHAT domain-containing protein